jgi:hypothetical protein
MRSEPRLALLVPLRTLFQFRIDCVRRHDEIGPINPEAAVWTVWVSEGRRSGAGSFEALIGLMDGVWFHVRGTRNLANSGGGVSLNWGYSLYAYFSVLN